MTGRHKDKQQLQTQPLVSQLLSPLLDALPDLCFLIARDGRIVAANTVATTTLQQPEASLRGRPFTSLLFQSSQAAFLADLAICFERNQMHHCVPMMTFPSGIAHDVDICLSVYSPGADAGDDLCVAIVRDISAERQKEIDLLRFSNVAHFTLNPLEITDVSGKIIYVNPAFERASGYSKEELIGRNPNVFGSGKHPKAFWQGMWKTITSGEVWVGEVENKRRNGDPYLTHLLISPIVDSKGLIIGYFGVHRDITEQRRLEQQLFQAQKMESIGTMAAGIAHEVGNPLTSISSLVQVVQRTSQDDFTKEKLELIKHQVTRISRIIRDLVDFSRPSTYEVQLTDINRCIRQAVDIVRVGKKSKTIQFDLALNEGVPSLHLVPDQVEQVLINILINAVDAVFDAQQQATDGYAGRITLSSRVTAENLEIIIVDNGKGMPKEEVEQIFEPFFTTKGVGEGTGLGLWVSYGIVKSFHGHIDVQSEQSKGSTFTILFPLHSHY
jgi:PAS domain S-box-containing protein